MVREIKIDYADEIKNDAVDFEFFLILINDSHFQRKSISTAR